MQHVRTALTIIAIVVFVPGAANAQSKLYKVVDAYGNVTYQDTPPDDDAGVRTEALEVEAPAAETPPPSTGNRDNILAAAQTRPLVLFSVPDCDSCDVVRWFLEQRELPFEEVDVRNDIGNQQRLRDATGEYRVPVLMVGETPLFGYDREALTAALVEAGYLPPAPPPPEAADGGEIAAPADGDAAVETADESAGDVDAGQSQAQ